MIESLLPPGPLVVDIPGTGLSAADRELLTHPAVGGVILFTHNYSDKVQLASLTRAIKAIRLYLLIAADTEGGSVQQFCDSFTRIPSMWALGQLSTREPDTAKRAAREIAWLIAVELVEVGVDLPLAPVVDIDYGPESFMHARAFASDAQTVSTLASAFCAGLVEAGSLATAKHFPGHGGVELDSHKALPVDNRSRGNLDKELTPYRKLIGENMPASVMMAHVLYPLVDDWPASLSTRWIEGVLRDELGFVGCVFCDNLNMEALSGFGDHIQRARMALAAGCDFLPISGNRAAVENLLESVLESDTERTRERRYEICAAVAASNRPQADKVRIQAARKLVNGLTIVQTSKPKY